MFKRHQPEDELLEKTIEDAYGSLQRCNPESEDYGTIVDQLTKLYALKRKPDRISSDAAWTIAANLFGIMMIVGHERAHNVTSKAIGFVRKLN